MCSSLDVARPADGSSPYLDEFQMFLSSYGVACGTPDDVSPFLEELAAREPVRKGLCSLIRAVFYRENAAVSHSALRTLVLEAVAGPDSADAALEEARQVCSGLVAQALSSLWRESQANAPAVPRTDPEAPAVAPFDQVAVPLRCAAPEAAAPEPSVLEQPVAVPVPPSAQPSLRPERISLDEIVSFHVRVSPGPVAATRTSVFRFAVGGWPTIPRVVWFGALCAILVPPGVDWLARQRTAEAISRGQSTVHKANAGAPKPEIFVPRAWSLKPLPADIAQGAALSRRGRSEKVSGRFDKDNSTPPALDRSVQPSGDHRH